MVTREKETELVRLEFFSCFWVLFALTCEKKGKRHEGSWMRARRYDRLCSAVFSESEETRYWKVWSFYPAAKAGCDTGEECAVRYLNKELSLFECEKECDLLVAPVIEQYMDRRAD